MWEVEAEKLEVQDKLLLVSAIAAYMGPFLKADGEKRKKKDESTWAEEMTR